MIVIIQVCALLLMRQKERLQVQMKMSVAVPEQDQVPRSPISAGNDRPESFHTPRVLPNNSHLEQRLFDYNTARGKYCASSQEYVDTGGGEACNFLQRAGLKPLRAANP